jgi:hypothetical protein
VQKTLRVATLVVVCFFAGECFGKSELKATSLCALQEKATEGTHATARVSAILNEWVTLEDAACPAQDTWVEFVLPAGHNKNKEKLRKPLDHYDRAYVSVEGEFYGPPLPDPKLPEAIRKAYHPGWGHLAAFKTKLVVHVICDVKVAPGAE